MAHTSKHTPAPWTVKSKEIAAHAYGKAKTVYAACKDGKPIPPSKANARLIAAAPELLEALKWMLEEYREDGNCNSSMNAAMENAIKSIAKAEGKAIC